jgi:hypothetical protein
LPNRALNNFELTSLAKQLKIPHFRGVFMLDNLPLKPWKNEASIINLDTASGNGTHWICFRKRGSKVDYFDSYGDLRPPLEIQRYLSGTYISYNRTGYQKVHDNSEICGHLCLAFLSLNE